MRFIRLSNTSVINDQQNENTNNYFGKKARQEKV